MCLQITVTYSPSCCQPGAGGSWGPAVLPGASPGCVSVQRPGDRWGFSEKGTVPVPICCARGVGTCWRAKLELLRCSRWPGSLPGGSSIPVGQALPPAALGISQVQVYLHRPVVLNGSKVASCFLAIMIPFSLSHAFHLEILEAFNW